MYASSSSSRSLTNRPASQYLPELGESRHPIKFISVDLPEPDGPMIATYSPLRISTSTPRSACTCSAPISYTLASSSVLITIPELTRSSRYESVDVVSTAMIFSSLLCCASALIFFRLLRCGVIDLDVGFWFQCAQRLVASDHDFIALLQPLSSSNLRNPYTFSPPTP